MAVKIQITSAGANISSILEIWTNASGPFTYYTGVTKTDLLLGYTFLPPISATAFQVKSTGTCTTVVDLQCACDPQYNWIPVGDGTFYREVITDAIPPSSPLTLIKADGFATYSAGGTRVYNPGFAIDGSSAPASTLTTNIIWKNLAANTTDGPLNRNGIWTNLSSGTGPTKKMYPMDTWIGFNYCLTGLTAGKTYYVGIAGDNDYKLALDGVTILNTKLTTLTNGSFFYWHIYPVTVNGGTSILSLFGLNRDTGAILNIAAFGCEIYDNTLAEITAATNISQLNIKFTSFGQSIATIVQTTGGTYLSSGYTCSSGIYYPCTTGKCVEKIICTGIITTTTTSTTIIPTTTTTESPVITTTTESPVTTTTNAPATTTTTESPVSTCSEYHIITTAPTYICDYSYILCEDTLPTTGTLNGYGEELYVCCKDGTVWITSGDGDAIQGSPCGSVITTTTTTTPEPTTTTTTAPGTTTTAAPAPEITTTTTTTNAPTTTTTTTNAPTTTTTNAPTTTTTNAPDTTTTTESPATTTTTTIIYDFTAMYSCPDITSYETTNLAYGSVSSGDRLTDGSSFYVVTSTYQGPSSPWSYPNVSVSAVIGQTGCPEITTTTTEAPITTTTNAPITTTTTEAPIITTTTTTIACTSYIVRNDNPYDVELNYVDCSIGSTSIHLASFTGGYTICASSHDTVIGIVLTNNGVCYPA